MIFFFLYFTGWSIWPPWHRAVKRMRFAAVLTVPSSVAFNWWQALCIAPLGALLCISVYTNRRHEPSGFPQPESPWPPVKKMHRKHQNICNWFDVPLTTWLSPVLVRALRQRLGPGMSPVHRWTWGLPPSPRWTCSEAPHSHWTLWTENSQHYTPGPSSEGLKEDVQ